VSSLRGKPGYKTVPVTVVLHLHEDVPEDWDDSDVRFWVEENHCISNYVIDLAKEEADQPGECHTCHRAEAFVGHVSFAGIRGAQEATPKPSP